MFKKPDLTGYKQVNEGVQRKVLLYGDKMIMTEFKLTAGSIVPEHKHPHEQIGYVVTGRIRMNVKGEQPFETGHGGAWSIPGDKLHSADALEDAVVVEVFHPLREDFLD